MPIETECFDMIPIGAKLEAVPFGGLALWDVSHIARFPTEEQYPDRDVDNIRAVFIHHSGVNGRPGWDGILSHVRYVNNKEWGRGWPAGSPYHFWAPHSPVFDADNRLCFFRLQPDRKLSFHTGGAANDLALSLALQGNTTEDGLSKSQVEILEGFIPWITELYDIPIRAVLGHCESAPFPGANPKATCPGTEAMRWLEAYRTGARFEYGSKP